MSIEKRAPRTGREQIKLLVKPINDCAALRHGQPIFLQIELNPPRLKTGLKPSLYRYKSRFKSLRVNNRRSLSFGAPMPWICTSGQGFQFVFQCEKLGFS